MNFTPGVRASLDAAAKALRVDPSWLEAVISFETASTWNPAIKNPKSSAQGLIQFTDSTARNLGYDNAADLVNQNYTATMQIDGPVLDYFQQYAPFANRDEFFLSVFEPSLRKKPLSTAISDSAQRVNPGIKTLGDYVAAVDLHYSKHGGNIAASGYIGGAVALLLFGLLLVKLWRSASNG